MVTDRGGDLLTVPMITNERRRSSCKLNISPVSIQARLSAAQTDGVGGGGGGSGGGGGGGGGDSDGGGS